MRTLKIFVSILIFSFSLINTSLKAQLVEKADQAYKMKTYYEAVDLYKKAYSQTKNKVEKRRIIFQIAQCYRLSFQIRKAEMQYKKTIRSKYPDPIAIYHYAEMLKRQGKLELAEEQYKLYTEKVPDDPRGHNGLKSCKDARDWIANPTRYEVENMGKMNSREDDFSPVFSDKKYTSIIFTTTRSDIGGKDDPNLGQSYSDIYITNQDKRGKWSAPQSVDIDEVINSEFNEGSAAFNKKFNTIYFTRCVRAKKTVRGCEIYISKKRGRGWTPAEELEIVADTITIGHPTLSKSEKVIYFSSDLPGGEGGKDIWMAKRKKRNKPFTKPVNLSSVINTPGDEVFPYLREYEDGRKALYFSSDGLVGMGGLDIYRSEWMGNKWGEPENMKSPVNSHADDFGIAFNKYPSSLLKAGAEEMGFFSSDRKGGRGNADIWSFMLPEIVHTLKGVIRDSLTIQPLKEAQITLTGSDGTVINIKTDQFGKYKFNREQIKKNTSYIVTAAKSMYYVKSGRESTVGLNKSTNLVLNLDLRPFSKDPILLPEIRFDNNKYNLLPQYEDSLTDLITTLKNNPTLVIELSAHTDHVGKDELNEILSLNRAKSCRSYCVEQGGIEAPRIVARGYGEYKPRKLIKGYTYPKSNKKYAGVSFPAGTILTEEYVTGLKSNRERQAALQLNRRVEFRILHDNFVPSDANDTSALVIQLNPDDNNVPFIGGGDDVILPAQVLMKPMKLQYIPTQDTATISLAQAADLLRVHKITKENFLDGAEAFARKTGQIKNNSVMIIEVINLGPKTRRKVLFKVVHDQTIDLMMGEEDLGGFGEYRIDNSGKKLVFEED